MAFGPIEAAPENREMAADLADELVGALTRAGISVVTGRGRPPSPDRSDQGNAASTRQLVVRLIDTETGGQLWAIAPTASCATKPQAANILRSDRGGAAAMPAAGRRSITRCAKPARLPRRLRSGAARHAGVLSLDANGNARALELLDRAIEMDPDHPLATALAAWAHVQRVVYHFTSAPTQERARSLELVHKARTLRNDATVLAILGNALSLLNAFDAADLVTRKALTIDGGSAWAWSRSGWIDVYKGDPLRHRAFQDRARPRAPRSAGFQQHGRHRLRAFHRRSICRRCTLAGAGAGRASLAQAGYIEPCARPMCCAGQAPQARRSLGALRQHYPDLTVPEVHAGMPPLPPSQCELVVGCAA
jgi:tetratricopeptide (TPR) repeat protein